MVQNFDSCFFDILFQVVLAGVWQLEFISIHLRTTKKSVESSSFFPRTLNFSLWKHFSRFFSNLIWLWKTLLSCCRRCCCCCFCVFFFQISSHKNFFTLEGEEFIWKLWRRLISSIFRIDTLENGDSNVTRKKHHQLSFDGYFEFETLPQLPTSTFFSFLQSRVSVTMSKNN